MYSRDDVIRIIREFISTIRNEGIKIQHAYLFGSYANESAREFSDIDVALISDDFRGVRFVDLSAIRTHLIHYIDLEIHPFNLQDFNENNPFAKTIIQNGYKIF